MSRKRAGLVVVGDSITVVAAEVPAENNSPIVLVSDDTWSLQKGERGPALSVLYKRCADFFSEREIELAVIKASALPQGAAKLALLGSAEVRGVVIAAAASVTKVDILSKAIVSRTYGDRKVDEYLKDDSFWNTQSTGAKLRKTSREAAMLILATRNA